MPARASSSPTAELLGIPHCVVIGDRGIAAGKLRIPQPAHQRQTREFCLKPSGRTSSSHSCASSAGARAAGRAGRLAWPSRPARRCRPAPSAIRSCVRSCSRPSDPRRTASATKYRLGGLVQADGAEAASPRGRPRRTDADAQDRVLRGASPRRQRLPPGLIWRSSTSRAASIAGPSHRRARWA